MRYGIAIPNWAPFDQELQIRLAVLADELGFDYVFFTDHLNNPHAELDGYPNEAVEAWMLISHVAGLTTRVRLGTSVTPIGIRPPAMLAKQVATVDRISGGRIDLGVGTGAGQGSYNFVGAEFGTYASRVAQLSEGVQLIRKLWAEPVVNFEGEFYSAENVVLGPKPIQRPGPPIWLGGFRPRLLKFAAEAADGWIPWHRPVDEYKDYLRQLNDFADEAGRSGKITAGTLVMVVNEKFRDTSLLKGQADPPHLTVSDARATAAAYEEAGAELFVILLFPAARAVQTVEQLASHLL
jgi:probable F420-dependent oxidoreductase